MKIIDAIKKEYTAWKWIRQAMKEARMRKKENEEKRKREWTRFFNQHSL